MADTRIDELRRRLERDPGSRLFAQLAEELRKGGELAEAIRVSRAGLAVHPSYASARLTLGRALVESGDAASGRVELETALREAPDNILASRFLAQAREALGDLKGAVEQYQKTLQMAPGDRQVQMQLSAVEAKLRAPATSGTTAGGETRPPTPRSAPPPLPASGSGAPEGSGTPARGTAGPVPPQRSVDPGAKRAGAPPVVFAPSRPMGPAPPEAEGEDFDAPSGLPPTVRILPSQAGPSPAPPPPPPQPPAAQAPPPPAAQAAARPVAPAPAPPVPPVAPTTETGRLPMGEFELAAKAPPGTVQHTWFAPVEPAAAEPPLPPTLVDPAHSAPAPEPPVANMAADNTVEHASERTSPFSSSTLAELYFQQGLVDRAVDVYRQLVQQDPSNEKARLRLVELENASAAPEDRMARRRALERTIAGLETLLAAVQRR